MKPPTDATKLTQNHTHRFITFLGEVFPSLEVNKTDGWADGYDLKFQLNTSACEFLITPGELLDLFSRTLVEMLLPRSDISQERKRG